MEQLVLHKITLITGFNIRLPNPMVKPAVKELVYQSVKSSQALPAYSKIIADGFIISPLNGIDKVKIG